MEIKISVIIPIYHPKKEYLDRLLDSVVRQTIGIEYIEIILVSDGDNTEETKNILNFWEQQYPENIMLIFYEENRKPGFARTLGIESSHGEYIAFADQDDWLSLEMYRVLYEKAKESKAEISGGFSTRDGTYEKPEVTRSFTDYGDVLWEINSTEERKKFLREKNMGGYWCSIYQREFLFENNIYFPEGFTYDDNFFGALCLFYVKRALVSGEYFYHWFVNEASISQVQNGETHFDRLKIEGLKIEAYKERGFFELYHDEIEREFLQMYYVNTWNTFFWHLDYIPHRTYLEMCRTIREEFPDYRRNIYLRSEKPEDDYMIFPIYPMLWDYSVETNDQDRIKILKRVPEKVRKLSWLDTMDGNMTEEDLTWFKFVYKLLPE